MKNLIIAVLAAVCNFMLVFSGFGIRAIVAFRRTVGSLIFAASLLVGSSVISSTAVAETNDVSCFSLFQLAIVLNQNKLNEILNAANKAKVSGIIERGCDVNDSNDRGETALHVATLFGQFEIVELLITNNANVNARVHTGETALHIAAHEGYSDILKLLLTNDAKVNARANNGLVALDWAKIKGHTKIVQLLKAAE